MGIISFLNSEDKTTTNTSIMRAFLAFSCLLAVAVGAPGPLGVGHGSHYQSSHHTSGGHTQDSYHSTSHGGHSAHKECETHYKTVYKTVIEHKKIQKCEDVPKEVCNYIEKEICHQTQEHSSGYGSGGSYNNHYQHQPEVCH